VIGPALVILQDGAWDAFEADHAAIEAGVLTAVGKFRQKTNGEIRRSDVTTRSWPMRQVREVRWHEAREARRSEPPIPNPQEEEGRGR
jgi:hypothetical protein